MGSSSAWRIWMRSIGFFFHPCSQYFVPSSPSPCARYQKISKLTYGCKCLVIHLSIPMNNNFFTISNVRVIVVRLVPSWIILVPNHISISELSRRCIVHWSKETKTQAHYSNFRFVFIGRLLCINLKYLKLYLSSVNHRHYFSWWEFLSFSPKIFVSIYFSYHFLYSSSGWCKFLLDILFGHWQSLCVTNFDWCVMQSTLPKKLLLQLNIDFVCIKHYV